MLRHLNTECCEVSAPAKLNLFLEVSAKRPDGYHELETLMVTISLFDTLRFRLDGPGQFNLRNHWCLPHRGSATLLPSGPDNLVIKAATLLAQETGVCHGAQIDLCKRIPLAAGLAGGSSDAAATLIGLNHLWQLGLSKVDLQELGARLGSDVPFFLASSSAAICRGRGEIIEPIALSSTLHFVIVKPTAGLSTAQVFQNCQPAQTPRSVDGLVRSLHSGQRGRIGSHMFNRLSAPAERLCADVSQLKECFQKLSVSGHLMSGSGTSYFGLCRNSLQARQLAGRLKSARSGQVFAVQSCS